MDKQNVAYIAIEYYSSLKGKENLTYATTWMSLGYLILREISLSQEDIVILLMQVLRVVRIIDRRWHGGCRGSEDGGDGVLLFNGYRVSVSQNEKSSGDGW